MKRLKNKDIQSGIFKSRQSFLVSLVIMGVISGFYHQWYEILAVKPQDFIRVFYQNFPLAILEYTLRLLPLLLPFYLLLDRFRKWPIWKRFLLFVLLAVGTTFIEELAEFYLSGFNHSQDDPGRSRFLAFLSFDMLGDILLFLGVLSGLGYVDHILCRNQILFMGLVEEKARLAEEEKLRLMGELEALQHQINPHFLFNTLNSLATLIVSNPSKAELLIRDMSDWYRDVLSTTRQDAWIIQDEIHLIQNYLRIESVRLEERLTVKIQCTEDARKIAIPPLVLQPLVENAVQHGIAPSISGGILSVDIKGTPDHFSILIEDTRHDSNMVLENHKMGTGSGLQNIKRRLELVFGDDLAFHFDMQEHGALASITVDRSLNAKS